MIKDIFEKIKALATHSHVQQDDSDALSFDPQQDQSVVDEDALAQEKLEARRRQMAQLNRSVEEADDNQFSKGLSTRNYRRAMADFLVQSASQIDEAYDETTGEPKDVNLDMESTFRNIQLDQKPPSREEVMHEILDTMSITTLPDPELVKSALSSDLAERYRKQWMLRIAADCETSDTVLRRLVTEGDNSVRAVIAENPSLPIDIAWGLSKDADADIRYALAENANVGFEILSQLNEDSNLYVSKRAKITLKRLTRNRLQEKNEINRRQAL